MSKFSRIQITASVLAVYGILQIAQFALTGFNFSELEYITRYPVEVSLWLLKTFIIPVGSLALATFAFLPNSFVSTKQLPFVTLILSGAFVAQELYMGFWQVSLGYPIVDAFVGVRLGADIESGLNVGRLLVIAALVVAVLEMRKQSALAGQKKTKGTKSAFKGFLGTLLDSKLENFISRKVSGVLYIVTAWILIAGALILEVAALGQMLQGNFLAGLVFLIAPFALLVVLIVIRMAFEAGIALIVIAENTKK